MGPIARQTLILNKIKVMGTISTKELADELKVSMMTVRRDLQTLSEKGLIEITHGGAVYKDDFTLEYPMTYKEAKYVEEKAAIAKFCKTLVSDNDSIFIETGTTTLAVANELVKSNLNDFYTNSLMVMNSLSKFEEINLFSVPGVYRDLSKGFLGSLSISYIENFHFDIAFVGTEGIDLDFGISVPNIDDALTKKSVIEHSEKVVLVADHSKFDRIYQCKVCDINKITHIVTDGQLDKNIVQKFEQKKIDIIVV